MSNYLTPQATKAYTNLLVALRTMPLTGVLRNQDRVELLISILPAGYLDKFNSNNGSGIDLAMSAQARYMIREVEQKLQAAREHNNLNKEYDTSPGLERRDSDLPASGGSYGNSAQTELALAIQTVRETVKSEATHMNLYSIMMKLYSHENVRKIAQTEAWLLDIHIGNACRDYVAMNRDEVVKFLFSHSNEFSKE